MSADPTVSALRSLVDSAKREQELQSFLEANPWMLIRHHVVGHFVISQFPLGPDHRCDFAYFVEQSGGSFLHLIEIESPTLEVFNSKDEFSGPFNHSAQQLEDWSAWCRGSSDHLESVLMPLFDDGYVTGIPTYNWLRLTLIAGRRSQMNNTKRKRRWRERVNNVPKGVEVRTWDGFIEELPLGRFSEAKDRDVACLRYSGLSYKKV